MSLKLGMKLRSLIILPINILPNRDKLSIQFPKCGKSTQKKSK